MTMTTPWTNAAVAVVVMGPSGVGKSTIGLRLADALGVPFAEGDKYHPSCNKHKMTSGDALSDADRLPWLRRLREEVIEALGSKGGVVLTCSALKRAYRDILRGGEGTSGDSSGVAVSVFFVELVADRAVVAQRLEGRKHEFMPPALMTSQYEVLEPLCLSEGEEEGAQVSVSGAVEEVVQRAAAEVHTWQATKH